MFTQAICLTHYSDEFITRLEMLGYVKSPFSTRRHATRDDFCILTSVIQRRENPEYIVVSKEEALSEDPTISWINKTAGRYVTDNEGLAFDLATLRNDDTDKHQLFVLECDLASLNDADKMQAKGELIFCTRDKWNVDLDENGRPSIFSSRNIPAHKATKEEIINYFSKKELI